MDEEHTAALPGRKLSLRFGAIKLYPLFEISVKCDMNRAIIEITWDNK